MRYTTQREEVDMSRARSIDIDGERVWFDTEQNGQRATGDQLELLAAVEDIDIDDLLDESLSQGQIILRLRQALHGTVVPADVLERRRAARRASEGQPVCLMCDAQKGRTRHHFVPRWIMRELGNYQTYAPRSQCTIPLCVECHRDIHYRGDDRPGKSIVEYLTPEQAATAQRILDDLKEQRPSVFDLIAGGNEYSYEYVLVKDYHAGKFAERAREIRVMTGESLRMTAAG